MIIQAMQRFPVLPGFFEYKGRGYLELEIKMEDNKTRIYKKNIEDF